jgi:hypothetical protein
MVELTAISLAEEEQSFTSTLTRQFLRTHRPFRAIVMDKTGKPILWVRKLSQNYPHSYVPEIT